MALLPLVYFVVKYVLICQSPSSNEVSRSEKLIRTEDSEYGVQVDHYVFLIIAFLFMQTKMAVVFFLWPFIWLLGAQICPALHDVTSVPLFLLLLWALFMWVLSYLHFSSMVDDLSPLDGQPLPLIWQVLFYTNNLHHLKNTQDISLSD